MANEFEITKVRLIIRQFLWETRKAVESAEAAQKWLIQFRNTLEYQELEENPDAYALAILAEARSFNNTKQRNQQMRWVRAALEKDGIKNPTQEQLDDKWLELYGTNQETTAYAPTREDGMNVPDGDTAARLESRPSAKTLSEARQVQARESRRTGTAVPELRRAAHSTAPVRRRGNGMPTNSTELYDMADRNGLDHTFARRCWDATIERGGKTKDGKDVENFEAYLISWCKSEQKKIENRRTA